jgi:tRNA threonylcarbamoyladenosine biosynthesis protein TsaE
MPDSHFKIPDEPAMAAFASRLAVRAAQGDVLLLSGGLGAGKTTFARAFIRARANDSLLEVPSPTFTLVQSYDLPSGTITHYDLWRLTGPRSLEELAWDEAQAGIVLVEWPDRLGALTPPHALNIGISLIADGREITMSGNDRWFDAS